MFVSLARVCHMYYEDGLTQQQIASRLHISRIKVSRLLNQARASNVVTIRIAYEGFFPELEAELAAKYPGVDFVVCDGLDGTADHLLQSLGSTAAEYLTRNLLLPKGQSVAVGWGQTMRSTAQHMSDSLRGTTFVPLIGGPSNTGLNVHANSVASMMAANTGGTSLAIFAPAVAESVDSKHAITGSLQVQSTLTAAANSGVCLFSVGSPFSPTSRIEHMDYYTEADIDKLRRSGAICDLINISYYTADARQVAEEISSRTISISEQQLRAIPQRICVAGGVSKHAAIEVVLKLGFATSLVLDDAAARYLLAS